MFKYDVLNFDVNEPHIVVRYALHLFLNITYDAHCMNEKFVIRYVCGDFFLFLLEQIKAIH